MHEICFSYPEAGEDLHPHRYSLANREVLESVAADSGIQRLLGYQACKHAHPSVRCGVFLECPQGNYKLCDFQVFFLVQADVLRLLVLRKYGGMYLDNDIYVINSLDKYRRYDVKTLAIF